jgi:hypothetical protein
MRSILQPDLRRGGRKCYLTGRGDHLQKHHIYPGKNRRVSDENGFWVWVTQGLHNGGDPAAIHSNPNHGYDLLLKQQCQRAYEETHSRGEFLSLIGRSYL